MSSVGTMDTMVTATSNIDDNDVSTSPPVDHPIANGTAPVSHQPLPADPKPSRVDETFTSESEYIEIANKLFNEDFVSIQPEEYTQFLAAGDEESSKIRSHYMNLFEWDANLLKATRMLCAKLYLKGESQEIDRILSAFTKAYIKQHPVNVFCTRNFEKIYIIIYSLILLNTALHNSELNKKSKISQPDYIKNTFTTFIHQNPKTSKKLSIKQRIIIERELSNFYEDLAKNELYLKQSDNTDEAHAAANAAAHAAASSRRLSRHTSSTQKQKNRSSALSEKLPEYEKEPKDDALGAATTVTTSLGSSSPDHSSSELASPPNPANAAANAAVSQFNSPLAPVAPGPATSAVSAATASSTSNTSDLPELSRHPSNTSIWSTDSNTRRSSLVMKRMVSATSGASQYTATGTNSNSNTRSRVGFTRALLSDQNQKFYKNGNSSRTSTTTSVSQAQPAIKNRQSLDYLRGAPSQSNGSSGNEYVHGNLNKRASRSSIVSRESTNSVAGDDTMSVLSFDTVNLKNFDLDGEHDGRLEDFNVDDYQDQYDLTLELQGSPYLKEGLLKLKILNNDQQDTISNDPATSSANSTTSASSSASGGSRFFSFFTRNSTNGPSAMRSPGSTVGTHTNLLSNKFVENFVVVSKGELSLYSFDQKIIKKHQQKIRKFKQKQLVVITELDEADSELIDEYEDDEDNIGDGNWLKNAAKIGNYNLCSTFAQLEKPGTSGSNGSKNVVLWSLTFPKVSKKPSKKFVFEAGTKEIALEYINTCNFWASKITAIPTLEESVSSIEYGWTNLDGIIQRKDQFKKNKQIMKWEPVPKGIYLSNYIVVSGEHDNQANHEGMMKQFIKTLSYYNHLKNLYHEFTKSKLKFLKHLPSKQYNCSNYTKVINNYNAKISEYKFDLTKYKHYLIILGFGLQLRFDLEDQDKLDALAARKEEHELEKARNRGSDDESEPPRTPSKSPQNTQDSDATSLVLEDDDELTKLVKVEIKKLFFNMKDIGKIIPTFQASKSIHDLTNVVREPYITQPIQNNEEVPPSPLVKSPKTFKLSNYNGNESPVNQLLKSSNSIVEDPQDVTYSYSTNTIKEEEEPEEEELEQEKPLEEKPQEEKPQEEIPQEEIPEETELGKELPNLPSKSP